MWKATFHLKQRQIYSSSPYCALAADIYQSKTDGSLSVAVGTMGRHFNSLV